jgi:hypothetical protein
VAGDAKRRLRAVRRQKLDAISAGGGFATTVLALRPKCKATNRGMVRIHGIPSAAHCAGVHLLFTTWCSNVVWERCVSC